MKAYQQAWEEHRTRYQKDMEKLEDENMRLKRKLAEAMRDIEAFSRIVGSKDA